MARGQAAPTHWLRANEREWTPAHALFVDTETRTTMVGDDEVLVLRCWAAKAVDRRNLRKTQPAVRDGQGSDRRSLAVWIGEAVTARKSSWLFCHNLTFDLTVTNLVDELIALGWKLGLEWSANDRAPWFRLSRNGQSLALADSVTWLPESLAKVAPYVGMKKLADPEPDDDPGWLQRCVSDTAILATAMLTLMDWWEKAGLGNWSVTGNGCGWNAMRHRTPRKSTLVVVGDGGREMERQAIYGGRRDAQRWGQVPGGPFVTLDFEDAYPMLAAHLRLPAKRMGAFDRLPLDAPELDDGAIQILAECTVTTTEARYPLRHNHAVWYPTGTFRTTLAAPEIAAARDRGDLVAIHRGYRYWCDGHLAGWAKWVMDLAHGRIPDAPPITALPAKRWGRSVLGRFALRIGVAEHYGPAQSVGWATSDLAWPGEGVHGKIVDLAGERWLVKQDQEADDSFPAVLAWVESYTRVRLNQMLDALGPTSWVSCNTDGAVVDLAEAAHSLPLGVGHNFKSNNPMAFAGRLCDRLHELTWPLVARPKDSFKDVWLAGPATLELDGRRVMSGISNTAVGRADGKLESRVWPGLAWQMSHGNRQGFVRPLQTYTVPAVTVHRWALSDGRTAPVVAYVGEDGVSGLVGPQSPLWAAGVLDLAEQQSRAVSRLLPAG